MVFPLREPAATCEAFREAVANVLEDLRVPPEAAQRELAALEPVNFEWLRDATLRSVLCDLEAFCGIELAYHSDLRIVQRNLNDVPHGSLGVNIPRIAVAGLLGRIVARAPGVH